MSEVVLQWLSSYVFVLFLPCRLSMYVSFCWYVRRYTQVVVVKVVVVDKHSKLLYVFVLWLLIILLFFSLSFLIKVAFFLVSSSIRKYGKIGEDRRGTP